MADTYVPAGRRIRPLRWQACLMRRVTTAAGGVERAGTMLWPVGWAFTERGAMRVARREIAKRNLPGTPVLVKLPDMGERPS